MSAPPCSISFDGAPLHFVHTPFSEPFLSLSNPTFAWAPELPKTTLLNKMNEYVLSKGSLLTGQQVVRVFLIQEHGHNRCEQGEAVPLATGLNEGVHTGNASCDEALHTTRQRENDGTSLYKHTCRLPAKKNCT